MKKIILILVLLALPLVCFGQDAEQPLQRFDKNSPLTLTIKSDKEVYERGEEIKLIVTIKNNSDKEMIVFWSDESPAEASGGGGTSLILMLDRLQHYAVYIKPKHSVDKVISPRKDSGPTFILHYDSRGIPLNFEHRPDQEIFTGSLTSNTITIEVVRKHTVSDYPVFVLHGYMDRIEKYAKYQSIFYEHLSVGHPLYQKHSIDNPTLENKIKTEYVKWRNEYQDVIDKEKLLTIAYSFDPTDPRRTFRLPTNLGETILKIFDLESEYYTVFLNFSLGGTDFLVFLYKVNKENYSIKRLEILLNTFYE